MPKKNSYVEHGGNMKTVSIHSLEETKELSNKLAALIGNQAALLLLEGDLGSGKTTFTKALGKAMGVKRTINSPTFTILKSYTMGDGRMLHHIDAYRMEGITQDLGFEEVFDEDALCVVEWPDFIKGFLPKEYLRMNIKRIGEEERCIELIPHGSLYEHIVEGL